METQGYRNNLKVNLKQLKHFLPLRKMVKLYKIVTLLSDP